MAPLGYATLQNSISSFPLIAPPSFHPGAIQGKEGMQFFHLATIPPLTYHEPFPELGGLPDLAENHGVEDDDGDVGNHLHQEELGPEDVVRDVLLKG